MPIGLQCTCGTLSVLRVVVSTLVLTSAINDYTGHNSMSWLIFFFPMNNYYLLQLGL